MTNVNRSGGWGMKVVTAYILLVSAAFGSMNRADADSAWWSGIFKPVSAEARAVTGKLELSPDYIFFVFGKDVGLQWRQVSCNAETCLFQVVDPKPVQLKDGKSLCPGSKAVRYIRIKRAGGREYSVSYLDSKAAASACLTAGYRQ